MAFTQKFSMATGLAYWSNDPTGALERLVLCIPGLGGPSSDYLPLLQMLAKDGSPSCLYVAPDLPGQGDSPSSLCPNPTFAGFARLLGELHDELGGPARGMVLIGHSMGCRVALEAFAQSPSVVSAVVLLDGSWHGQHPPTVPKPEEMPPREVQVQYALSGLEGIFGPHTPEAFKEKYRRVFQVADMDYMARLTVENRRWDAERMLEALRQIQTANSGGHAVQLLLVQAMDGAGGPRRPLKKGEETTWMQTARENAGSAYSCLVVEDSGHWPHVDKTDEVAQAILRLISNSSKPAAEV